MTSQVDVKAAAAPAAAAPQKPAANGDGAAAADALEGGSYDVIRRRLLDQTAELAQKAESLNDKRKKVFGGAELALLANERVRTEHNGIPRDMVSVAGHMLFGFEVFLGLQTETKVEDVLAFYRFQQKGEGWDLDQVPFEGPGAFLADEAFTKELRDAFKYAKDAKILRLARTDTRLFLVVRVGATQRDVKVFRWSIDAQGRLTYLDARGDDEAQPPKQHDFGWTPTRREDQVPGAHPHVNILDTCFVETVGGDLTIKVENNTKDGRGIYSEPVDDVNQSLDDADIAYAKLGHLVLLRVKPFREERFRYLVFDARGRRAERIDAIGVACQQLPEDHGIVFPGGYYLQTGEHKLFDGDYSGLVFERVVKSPNGEDVVYVYYQDSDGSYLLLPYNLIRKEVTSPIRSNGYRLFADGTMAVFRAATEPTRVHPLQIWRTPFTSAEWAASAPKDGSYLSKVGNADLVRGISDAFSLRKLAAAERPTRLSYEDLVAATTRAIDAHYWLGNAECFDLLSTLTSIKKTSLLVLDEFDKVEAIEKRAREAFDEAGAQQKQLLLSARADDLKVVEDYLRALTTLRQQRGKLISLRDMRGMDLAAVAKLEGEVAGRFDEVSLACVEFFLKDDAFKPLLSRLDAVVAHVQATEKAADLAQYATELDLVQQGLTLLAEVISGLKIDDATARTKILEGVSEAFSQQNRARAVWQGRKKELGSSEGRAEFAAQFRLFGQSVTGALALCDTPEACDAQMSKLLLSLEELEGRFGQFDEFTGDLAQKREEVNDAIGARRQQLLDERSRRAQSLWTAAERILSGVARRSKTFSTVDELNAYFASDAMVLKLGDVKEQLAALGDSVKSDEVASRVKSARQEALRALRDKADLFEGGDDVIKLGEHRFSVQTQALELVLVARDGAMNLHLSGTDFFEPIDASEAAGGVSLADFADLWDASLPSESAEVYRGEHLAACMLFDAEDGARGLTIEALTEAARDEAKLLEAVRRYALDRLDEGYERGIHDADSAKILSKLLMLRASAGLLRFSPDARALAQLAFAGLDDGARRVLVARAKSLGRLRAETAYAGAQATLAAELAATTIAPRAEALGLSCTPADAAAAARYLVEELAAPQPRFVVSAAADALARAVLTSIDQRGSRRAFDEELRALAEQPAARLALAVAYADALAGVVQPVIAEPVPSSRAPSADAAPPSRRATSMAATSAAAPEPAPKDPGAAMRPFVREAAVLLAFERAVDRERSTATTDAVVTGLLGSHARITGGAMHLAIDELVARLAPFVATRVPRFRALRKTKSAVLERARGRLRMDEWRPRVLTSFVRNGLIDKVYLPLVGANLAKQLGAVGDKKRTDLMGMLLLVSPPGYGKTTLMEYVASKLGLVFMKVNGPSIGNEVTSLDPADAKSATARQEVEKINLAFEMGNNVMLYLDDIQHTSSELLQKFISLCDAQRKIEGVWKGRPRTYDLRGKKFCVVMAGNPYTETGARFQIPDMLANRADTYNLGDILGGAEQLFAESYVENALTSNSALAPLATREPADVGKLVRMARGEEVALTDLAHGYSAAEVDEVVSVLKRLSKVQRLLLDVNKQYIASASQSDAFRTEPPFKLQGSYRNMNKLAEKVVAAMNDDELERLVDDHYASESQTLTTGAEQNLLKLAELRGRMTDAQKARWKDIKDSYARTQRAGGKSDDPASRVTGAISGLDERLSRIGDAIARAAKQAADAAMFHDAPGAGSAASDMHMAKLGDAIRLMAQSRTKVEVRLDDGGRDVAGMIADVVREHARAIEKALAAIVELTRGGHGPGSPVVHQRVDELVGMVKQIESRLTSVHAPAPRFDVVLGPSSASNFFRPAESYDVLGHGGLFVATASERPPLGAAVLLTLHFPGGAACDATATVTFTQDDLGEDAPPGFGAKLDAVNAAGAALVTEFVRAHAPLIH
jgi:hypothetical protein